jgi:hypothetical protein
MAAWDLGRFPYLADAFDGLSEKLLKCFDDPKTRIYRQMERVILQVHWKCQSYMYDQNVDLGDFCELLDVECGRVAQELGEGEDVEFLRGEVQQQCRTVLEELNRAVILSGFSGGGYQYSNGVSVFFPWSSEAYEVSRENYESLSLWFAKDVQRKRLSWTDFLQKYLYEVTFRKSEAPVEDVPVPMGARYKYRSGVRFDERYDNGVYLGAAAMAAAAAGGSVKIAGQEGSKIAGQEGSKIAGQEGSKIAGQEGSKIAGQEGSKIAGQEGSKIAGGGSNAFFNSLRLFKNIESRWDVSGFTKKLD